MKTSKTYGGTVFSGENGSGVLNGNGEAVVTFQNPFQRKPGLVLLLEESANNQPVVFKVKTWAQNGSGYYTGATIRGYRSQTLPSVLTLITQLISFNIFGGVITGVGFSWVAL